MMFNVYISFILNAHLMLSYFINSNTFTKAEFKDLLYLLGHRLSNITV